VDGREFAAGRRSTTGHLLERLLLAISEKHPGWKITVAMTKQCALPLALDDRVSTIYLPHGFAMWWMFLSYRMDMSIRFRSGALLMGRRGCSGLASTQRLWLPELH